MSELLIFERYRFLHKRYAKGAGIVSGQDVSKAKELGSKGILVASGIVKAGNWEKIISEFCKGLKSQ